MNRSRSTRSTRPAAPADTASVSPSQTTSPITRGERPDVFDFLDHRAYLRALCTHGGENGERAFSHRAFCKRAGLRSTNYLSLVMKGERNLSAAMARRFAKACGLAGREQDYFCQLVVLDQAKGSAARDLAYAQLGRFRRFREVHTIDAAQAAYHAHWFVPAVRELCTRRDFQEDPAWIARTLLPRITRVQAREAIATLLRLGLVARDADGRLRQVNALVTTGESPHREHVIRYHRAMLERASEALELIPRPEREISSLTLCVSEETRELLCRRINEVRRELLQLAEADGNPERVVQINFQLFPLSDRRGASDEP
jgi:uncharacterized protein (TIGR02147 family)